MIPRFKPSVISGATADGQLFKLPSTIIDPQFTSERNFLLNPSHPDFGQIQFLASKPFSFDSRLK